jgi:transposase
MPGKEYSLEFKQEAIKLVTEQGLSHKKAAEEIGIPASTMSGWVYRLKKRGKTQDKQSPNSPDQEKIKKLEKEVRILKMEREILKKSVAFFAKENQ